MKRLFVMGLLAVSLSAVAKLPKLTFISETDTIEASYDDAPRILYDRYWSVDYNAAVDKFLSDEGLGRYRSVADDVLARIAVSRMFLNSGVVDRDPWRVDMVADSGTEIMVSPRVFRQLKELMAMINRSVNDRIDFQHSSRDHDKASAIRDLSVVSSRREIWEKEALDPDIYAETSFTYPLASPQGDPQLLPDTITGIIDYNPWRYAFNERMPVERELSWWLNDMTAKSRFFGHVTRNEQGILVQNSTAEALGLSPRVWQFFTEVLDGLNAPTPRVNNPAEAWTSNPAEAKAKAEAFFLDKNRGGSVRVFKRNGEPRKVTENYKRTVRPTPFDYRLDLFRKI